MDFIVNFLRKVSTYSSQSPRPSRSRILSQNSILLLVAFVLLAKSDAALAQAPVFDDSEIRIAVCQLMDLMNSSLGALLTAVAGIGAIVGAAFGAYKASMSMITVATASYIMPTLVGLWFGGIVCQSNQPGEFDSVGTEQTGPVYAPTGSADCSNIDVMTEDCGSDLETQECDSIFNSETCSGSDSGGVEVEVPAEAEGVPVEIPTEAEGVPVEIPTTVDVEEQPTVSDQELLGGEDECVEWQQLNPGVNIHMYGPLHCRARDFNE